MCRFTGSRSLILFDFFVCPKVLMACKVCVVFLALFFLFSPSSHAHLFRSLLFSTHYSITFWTFIFHSIMWRLTFNGPCVHSILYVIHVWVSKNRFKCKHTENRMISFFCEKTFAHFAITSTKSTFDSHCLWGKFVYKREKCTYIEYMHII